MYGLQLTHVRCSADCGLVFNARSKTDQFRRGTWINIVTLHNCSLCPGLFVPDILLLGLTVEFFYLCTRMASRRPNSKFVRCLENACFFPGPLKYFSTYSFRIGAATETFNKGLNARVIKKLGRWKSACFQRFIRPCLL